MIAMYHTNVRRATKAYLLTITNFHLQTDLKLCADSGGHGIPMQWQIQADRDSFLPVV